VRFRTIGDMTCTGATESTAKDLADIVNEIAATRVTERAWSRLTPLLGYAA
jgi:sulfate adenylyltransferase subunit 2